MLISYRIRTSVAWILATALTCCLWTGRAVVADEDKGTGDWEFSVAPFLWAPSIKGDVTVRGRSSSVEASFKDIVQDADSILAYFSQFEARNNRLALFLLPSYMDIEMDSSTKVGPLKFDSDASSKLFYLEFGAAYQVFEWERPAKQETFSSGTLEVLMGLRYTDIDGKIHLNVAGLPPGFPFTVPYPTSRYRPVPRSRRRASTSTSRAPGTRGEAARRVPSPRRVAPSRSGR